MKQAFIWDLDGTLLDSYTLIVPCLQETLEQAGLFMPQEEIRNIILKDSVTTLIELGSQRTGLPFDTLMGHYKALSESRLPEIPLMPGAREILEDLHERGVRHYVFTHRGASSLPVLEHLGIASYFEEVVTSLYPLPRKPAPDGILYLLEKYSLGRESACYVGDRRLDMDCAYNAKIVGILLHAPDSPAAPAGTEAAVVQSLMDIPLLLEQGVI